MPEYKTLQGILALIDIVNFTGQAAKLGEKFTAQYTAYFQEKIKGIVEKHRFQVWLNTLEVIYQAVVVNHGSRRLLVNQRIALLQKCMKV